MRYVSERTYVATYDAAVIGTQESADAGDDEHVYDEVSGGAAQEEAFEATYAAYEAVIA